MPAATINDDAFDDFEPGAPLGFFPVPFSPTIPTTSLNDVGDRVNLLAIGAGRRIGYIDILSNDAGDSHATPTLDADLVLSVGAESDGDGTETVLYNAGTRFQAASTTFVRTPVDILIADSVDSKGVVRLKVNTAAATPAEMDLSGVLWVQ